MQSTHFFSEVHNTHIQRHTKQRIGFKKEAAFLDKVDMLEHLKNQIKFTSGKNIQK